MFEINATPLIAMALVAFVALQHIGFLVLEMFLFNKPTGRKIFRLKQEDADLMAPLAANQGLYNGFLAAGLIWSLVSMWTWPMGARPLALFFLGCVVVAGLYGGVTVQRTIWVIQALPAAIALVAAYLWLPRPF